MSLIDCRSIYHRLFQYQRTQQVLSTSCRHLIPYQSTQTAYKEAAQCMKTC
jgi:hypothetical protein